MQRAERGTTSVEYLGLIAVVAAVIVALLSLGLGDKLATALTDVICRITGGACPVAGEQAGPPPTSGSIGDRIVRLQANADRRRTQLGIETPDAAGTHYADLQNQIREAITGGRVDEAERLDAMLEMYARLARGNDFSRSDRGALVEDLWMSDAKWRDAVHQGTIYTAPDGDNVRYFDIPKAPGDGLLAMDYFIPFETSGPPPVQLKGDNRDFNPGGPLSPDLPLNKSRVLVLLDRETGRGAIYQSHTCNASYGQCREARPIALDMDERTQYVPQLSDKINGPYIAPTNRYEVTGDGDSVRLKYDALNSMTWPVFAVEGTVRLTRDDTGTYRVTEDDRDHYPSIGIYQYRPGEEPHVIQERPSENVFAGATDHEWLPWLPGG